MSISGNLETMELAELLQWVASSGKTGTLVIGRPEVQKRIFFEDGRIIATGSTDPKEQLGHFLVSHGYITETELVGLSWGRVGTPVIFGSGDDRLARDLATMPWIEFVTVKTAVGADSAAPRPLEEARAELTAKARRAVEKLRAGETQAM